MNINKLFIGDVFQTTLQWTFFDDNFIKNSFENPIHLGFLKRLFAHWTFIVALLFPFGDTLFAEHLIALITRVRI
jgi:hypothetical protein